MGTPRRRRRTDLVSIIKAEASGRFWPLLFVGYFAFQALYRRALGGSLGLDEAQAMVEAQRLALGYGAQPPLYNWLQWGAFRAIPDPLLAIALLKDALLAVTFLAVYALFGSAHRPRVAGLAAASLMLLPQIAWESQRALTHSVLTTALAAVSVLVFWTWVVAGRRGGYLLFGLVTALGLISKANFWFVPAALLVASVSAPDVRPRLRPAGLALSLGVTALLVAAPAQWMLAHPEQALASAHKFERAAGGSWALAALTGLSSVALASAGFLGLLAVVEGVIGWRFRSGNAMPAAALDRFLLRFLLTGLALVVVAVLALGATNVQDRWLLPVLSLAAPLATVRLLAHVGQAGERWLARVLAGIAILVVLALPVHLITGTPGAPARGNAPIGELAAALPVGSAGVIAEPKWLAGNLLYRRPDWRVEDTETAVPPVGETVLLVWPDDPDRGAGIADTLAKRAGRPLRLGAPVRYAAPYSWQPGSDFVLYAAPLAPAP